MTDQGAEPEEREALRHRLYRPDASDEDRRRFAALDDETAPVLPDASAADPRTRRRTGAATLAGAAALLAAIAAVVLAIPRTPTPGPTTSPAAPATVGRQIAAGLVRPGPGSPTPTPIATTVAGIPTTVQRARGTGTAVVAIDTRTAQHRNGTMLVMLTSRSARTLGWLATRALTTTVGPSTAEVVAEREPGPVVPDEPPAYSIVGYDGAPATRLLVEDPDSIGWTLTIGFLPRRTLPY